MTKNTHKGQVALVLVLIMTVVSTLAVSLATRSTVDTKIQQSESESIQALLFAQTGIEQLILNPTSSVGEPGSDYYAETSDIGKDVIEFGSLAQGSTMEINLLPRDALLTGMRVFWGPDNDSSSNRPAVLISVVESTGTITDYAYDYDGLNGFTAATNVAGRYPKTSETIALNSNTTKVRITVLGTSAVMRVDPVGAPFPSQFKSIKSIGSKVSGPDSVKYGLQYDESATDSVPGVFDYVLFSGGSIIQ